MAKAPVKSEMKNLSAENTKNLGLCCIDKVLIKEKKYSEMANADRKSA